MTSDTNDMSDRFGKFQTFFFGTIVTLIMVAIWTNLGPVSLVTVIIINVLMFVGIFSCMIPSQAHWPFRSWGL